MNTPIVIVGAGGHAKAIADALLESGQHVLGFVDPDASKHGTQILGRPVLGTDDALNAYPQGSIRLANGLGGIKSTAARRAVQTRLESLGWLFVGVQHPSAVISKHAQIGPGVQILPNAVIQAGARVGANTIVNTAAIIEHDVQIGTYVHVAPGATLCGDVVVADGCHIGARALIRQGGKLGSNTVVGAGAVVVKDFPAGVTLVGVPANTLGD